MRDTHRPSFSKDYYFWKKKKKKSPAKNQKCCVHISTCSLTLGNPHVGSCCLLPCNGIRMRQRWYRSKHLSLPHTHTHTHNCWSNISQETLWSRRNERANPFSPLRSLSLSCSLSLSKTILYLSLSVVLSSSFLVNNIFPLSLSFCLSATFTSKNPVKGREREREWESATELNIHTSVCIYVLRGDWSAWFAERLGLINPPFKPNEPSSASFHLHSASVCLCTFLHVSTFISIKRWKFSSSCSEVLKCKCGPVTGSVIC